MASMALLARGSLVIETRLPTTRTPRPLVFFDERISPDNLSLSPGDMDEAVLTMIRIVETNQDRLGDGFLFEAVAALRTGFTEGFDSCDP